MKHQSSIATLLTLSLASPLALALGLGEPIVRSSLDAPLRARIPLTDTAGLDLERLEVALADAAAYRDAGLVRTPLAAGVRVGLERDQGRPVLALATDQAVREPWLDLLLRLDWPGGSRLSEITLLLDPADYAAMPTLFEGAAAPRGAASAGAPPAAGNPAWVRSGDTLWAVAARLRPDDGIGMNQMMVALVEANPGAFPSGNIHQMRAGVSLDVPPRAALVARSPARAGEVVRAMNRAWAEGGDGPPAAWGDEPPAVAATTSDPASAPEGDAAASPRPRLTLLTEEEAAEAGEQEPAMVAVEPAPTSVAHRRLEADVLASITGRGGPGEPARLARLERRWEETRERLVEVRDERDALSAELGSLREEVGALRARVATLAGEGVPGARPGGVTPTGGDRDRDVPWWRAAIGMPWMLGGVALALLLAVWGWRRDRRAPTGDPFGDLRVAAPAGEGLSSGAGGSAESTGRSGRAAMPEAEAISEADVFIAYGRYDQARELLEAGLAREPGRADLRLTLMRVQLEQGDRAAAERQAAWLRDVDDRAVRDEAERLLGTSADDGRRDGEGAGGMPSAPEGESPREPGEAGVGVEAPGDAPAAERAQDDLPRVPRAASDEGRVIDYRPPTLEPAEPREETPRQPEIDIAAATTGASDEQAPPDWEVEEVAFPPLGGDNGGSADAAVSGATLAEARHLFEVGEVREARLLLERLLEASDDTGLREEARDLLDRYQP